MAAGLAAPVQAQENLDAGKSPSQLFGGNCSACHKSPRGLLKTVAPGSLQGFLRQHYTTGPEMAGVLSSYLVSNGAGDVRYMGKGAKDGGKDGKPETASAPSDQPERSGRRHRVRSAEPAEAGQAAPASEAAGTDADPKPRHHGRKSAKHKRGKPAGDEAAEPDGGKADTAKPARDEKPAAAERSSESPRVEAPKESEPAPTLRAEPAPSAASPSTTQSIPSAGGDDSK